MSVNIFRWRRIHKLNDLRYSDKPHSLKPVSKVREPVEKRRNGEEEKQRQAVDERNKQLLIAAGEM